MSRKKIFDQDSTKLVKKETAERQVFEYLRKRKGQWVTQAQICKSLDISQPTISRVLNKLTKKNKSYGKKEYIVIYSNNHYQMTHPENMPIKFTLNPNPIQVDKFNGALDTEAESLSNQKIWHKEFATRVNSTVILYEINNRYRAKVQTSLVKLFSENIYDIVSCEKGIYIILRENNNLSEVRKRIMDLYIQSVHYSKE